MAIIPGRRFLVMNLMDNGRNMTAKRIQLVNDEEDEDAELNASTAATAFVSAFMATTGAELVSWFQYLEHVEEDVVVPAAGVQIEDQALLLFDIVGSPQKTATFSIPAPLIDIFSATSGAGANIVDTADAAIQSLRDTFISDAPNWLAYISDGEHANSLISGKRIHRGSRRG